MVDKITVVCHKDHVVSYEDYRGRCLLCLVEDLMQEVGRLTAVCKEKEWVGLTEEELDEAMKYWSDDSRSTYGGALIADGEYVNMRDTWRYIEAKLKEKNT